MRDGYRIRGRVWARADGPPGLAVLYLHGIQSHGGWYEYSGSLLAQSGLIVLMPDRRGSGLNEAERGHVVRATTWLEDLDDIAAVARREFGAERFAVVGVSWGGKLATAWAAENPGRTGALLLVAPGIFPAVDIGILARIRVGFCCLTNPRARFPIPLNDPRMFTSSPEGQAFIADDPLKLTSATARFFYCSSRLDARLWRLSPGTLASPTTLLLAGNDQIISNDVTAAWLRGVCRSAPQIHTFDGAGHTLEFEPDVEPYAAALRRWMERVAAGAAATASGG